MSVWMDACMHACTHACMCIIYMCVCAYKTNGENKKRDKKRHAKHFDSPTRHVKEETGVLHLPFWRRGGLPSHHRAQRACGRQVAWTKLHGTQLPCGSNKPRPEPKSKPHQLEPRDPQIHGISKNGCRRTSEGTPLWHGLHTSHCIPMKWLVSCPRIICWLYQYISYIPWNPRRNPYQNQRLVSHSAPAPPKATRTWAQLLPSESGILIVFSPGPWAVDPTGG